MTLWQLRTAGALVLSSLLFISGCSEQPDAPDGSAAIAVTAPSTIVQTSRGPETTSSSTKPPAETTDVAVQTMPARAAMSWVVSEGDGWLGVETESFGRLMASSDGLTWDWLEFDRVAFGQFNKLQRWRDQTILVIHEGGFTGLFLVASDGTLTRSQELEKLLHPELLGALKDIRPEASLFLEGRNGQSADFADSSWPCGEIPLNPEARAFGMIESEPFAVPLPDSATVPTLFLFDGGFGFIAERSELDDCASIQQTQFGLWLWRPTTGFEHAIDLDHDPSEARSFGILVDPTVSVSDEGVALVAANRTSYVSTDASLSAWTPIPLPAPAVATFASPHEHVLVSVTEFGGDVHLTRPGQPWVQVPLEGHALPIPWGADADAVYLDDVGTTSGRLRLRVEW